MRGKISQLVAAALLASGSLWAQSAPQRVQAATGTAQDVDRVQAATRQTEEPLSFQAEADLGEQRILEPRANVMGVYGLAEAGLFYTSNATLTPGGGSGDMYFYARGQAGLRPHLGGGLYLNGFVSQDVYTYARFSALDFLKFSAGGGLDYVISPLGGVVASVHYKYERYLDTDSLDEFFVNNAIEVGLSKEFPLNDIHAIQAGWKSSFSVYAEPDLVRRDEHTFWLGWRWRIIEPIELQVYDFLSLYYYPNMGSRFDVTNYSGAALNVSFTRWARLSVAGGFSVNSSTQSIFNYTAANVGGVATLQFTF